MNLVHAHDVVGGIVCKLADVVEILFLFHFLDFCGRVCQVFLVRDMRFALLRWTFHIVINLRRRTFTLVLLTKRRHIFYFINLSRGIDQMFLWLRYRE